MSKKYIILTPGIANMGGSEMFTYNKWKYLTSHGWDVDIFFFNKGEHFCLKELEKYKNNCIPDLIYGISFLSSRRKKDILDRILSNVTQNDEIVVESHLYSLTLWGEMIVERMGGRSIVNCMEENIDQISLAEAEFMEFKLKRHEILNASVKSLHRYFGQCYKDEYEKYTHSYMRAYCSNVVTRTVKAEIEIKKADFNILSIGRLEKPYVLPTFAEVRKFVDLHHDKFFNIIVIGGDPKGDVEGKIRTVFNGVKNVYFLFLGYMFPVPSNLIEINNVAIASANSVLVPSNEGVPTIAIDIHDNLPIGIYGRTTNNKFSRDSEPATSIVELLDDVLIKGLYPKSNPILRNEKAEMEEVFGKQLDFLKLSSSDGTAYPVEELYSVWRVLYDRTKYYLHKLGL